MPGHFIRCVGLFAKRQCNDLPFKLESGLIFQIPPRKVSWVKLVLEVQFSKPPSHLISALYDVTSFQSPPKIIKPTEVAKSSSSLNNTIRRGNSAMPSWYIPCHNFLLISMSQDNALQSIFHFKCTHLQDQFISFHGYIFFGSWCAFLKWTE